MADVFLFPGEASPNDVRLGQVAGGTVVLITAAIAGSSTVTATVTRYKQVAPAAISGTSAVTAAVTRFRARPATIAGTATVTAAVTRVRARPATINGNSAVTASVVRLRARNAAAAGTSSVSAAIVRVRARSASTQGVATVTVAVARVRARTATIAGSSSVTVVVGRIRTVTAAAINGSSSVSAAVVRVRARAATAAGVATVSAAVVRLRAVSATAQGVATVAASVVRTRARTATIAGSSAVTVSLVRDPLAVTAAIHGASTVTASVVRLRARSATAAGASTVTAAVTRLRRITPAAIQGQAAVTATVVRIRSRSAAIHGGKGGAKAFLNVNLPNPNSDLFLEAFEAGTAGNLYRFGIFSPVGPNAPLTIVEDNSGGAAPFIKVFPASNGASAIISTAAQVAAAITAAVYLGDQRVRATYEGDGSGIVTTYGPSFPFFAGGTFAVSASLVRTRARTATIAGSSTVTAIVSRVPLIIHAAIAGSSAVTATVTRVRARAATIAGTATVTVVVGRVRPLVPAAIQGRATVTVTLYRVRARAVAIHGGKGRTRASLSVNLPNPNSDLFLEALEAGTAGNLYKFGILSPTGPNAPLTIVMDGSGGGAPFIQVRPASDGANQITSTAAQVAAAINNTTYLGDRPVRVSFEGDGSGIVTTFGPSFPFFTGGTFAVTAAAVRVRARAASATGRSTVTASVVRVRARAAAAAGSSTVTVHISGVAIPIAASIAGTSTVAASVVRTRARSASVAGVSTVTASLVRDRAFSISIGGASTVTATVTAVGPPFDSGVSTFTLITLGSGAPGPAPGVAGVGGTPVVRRRYPPARLPKLDRGQSIIVLVTSGHGRVYGDSQEDEELLLGLYDLVR